MDEPTMFSEHLMNIAEYMHIINASGNEPQTDIFIAKKICSQNDHAVRRIENDKLPDFCSKLESLPAVTNFTVVFFGNPCLFTDTFIRLVLTLPALCEVQIVNKFDVPIPEIFLSAIINRPTIKNLVFREFPRSFYLSSEFTILKHCRRPLMIEISSYSSIVYNGLDFCEIFEGSPYVYVRFGYTCAQTNMFRELTHNSIEDWQKGLELHETRRMKAARS